MSTEDGMKVYDQPRDTWIEIPIPRLRSTKTDLGTSAEGEEAAEQEGQEDTKVVYLLQHLLRCGSE